MTVFTVRPDSTASGASSYTVTGAASVHAALNDNSDASYIRKTGTGTASVIVNMDSTGVGSTQAVRQVRLRARVQTPTSAGKLNLYLGTRTGGANFFAPALAVRGTNAIGEITGPYLTVAPNGASWNQELINALRVQVTDYKSTTDRAYTYELYIDVDITDEPTCTVVAPTGTISDTAKPEVSWTFTDPDGVDGQSYYQVKVYTQAQYDNAEFNPATTAPEWDSGVVASADTTTIIDEYLTNATHRAYVRVGKTVGSQILYSDWAYSQFVVSLTAPSVPTLTGAYVSATNKVTLELNGSQALAFDYQLFEVQRSTDQITWETIRNGDQIVPGQNYDKGVTDYEAPRGANVYYRVRSVGIAGDNVIASAWSATLTLSVTNDGTWWLKAITAPALNAGNVRILAGLGVTIEEDLGVFRPIGRALPVVVSGTIGGMDGEYSIVTTTEAEWSATYALATHQGQILIQAPDGAQKYVRFISRTWEETGATGSLRREVTLGYVETDGQ